MLANALEVHGGGDKPIITEDLEERRLDPNAEGEKELPDFVQ